MQGKNDAVQGNDVSDDRGGDGDGNRNRGDAGGLVPRHVGHVTLPTAAASEAAALISMIERAAADPRMDVERVERMYAMYERAAARNAKASYDNAMAMMQPQLPVIDKLGKGHNGKSYARWEDIAEGIMSVTAQHGFSLTFRVKPTDKQVEITAILAHRDGHREETSYPFPLDTSGAKNPIQSVGSSMSYGKRYTACALLNVITRDEDDDGARAIRQKSSSAAKKDGTDRVFAEIINDIKTAASPDMLRHIVSEVWKDEIEALPFKWRDLARDEYQEKMAQFEAVGAR